MLTPTVPEDSVCRLLYDGQVGTAGVNATIELDLSVLTEPILSDPNFVDNWRVFVRQVDDGITEVSPDLDFTIVDGVPTEMIITLTAANVTDTLSLEAVFTPTQVR